MQHSSLSELTTVRSLFVGKSSFRPLMMRDLPGLKNADSTSWGIEDANLLAGVKLKDAALFKVGKGVESIERLVVAFVTVQVGTHDFLEPFTRSASGAPSTSLKMKQ